VKSAGDVQSHICCHVLMWLVGVQETPTLTVLCCLRKAVARVAVPKLMQDTWLKAETCFC